MATTDLLLLRLVLSGEREAELHTLTDTVGKGRTDCWQFSQYTRVSRSVPIVLRAASKVMRVGTDLDVLVSVEIGAVPVQIETKFQHGRDLSSDAKLLIYQYGQEQSLGTSQQY